MTTSRSTPNTGPSSDDSPTSAASLLAQAAALIARLEQLLPAPLPAPDWTSAAMRWRKRGLASGYLESIARPTSIALSDLQYIDRQKKILVQNTKQFVDGHPANNVLLTGARGTGKSSLIKACLAEFAPSGLRLIEVDKADLVDLSDIVALIALRPERFIIYCDDLSFEEGESGYKALKVALDGSLSSASENVLVYATSNRRHLMPEQMRENLSYRHDDDGELHPREVTEEKISLSERFGLWLSFYPFRQEEYLAIVIHWLRRLGHADVAIDTVREEALQWALQRGSRSGRIASQFARDWSGRHSAGLDG